MQQRKRGDNVEENEELVERVPAHAEGYLRVTCQPPAARPPPPTRKKVAVIKQPASLVTGDSTLPVTAQAPVRYGVRACELLVQAGCSVNH